MRVLPSLVAVLVLRYATAAAPAVADPEDSFWRETLGSAICLPEETLHLLDRAGYELSKSDRQCFWRGDSPLQLIMFFHGCLNKIHDDALKNILEDWALDLHGLSGAQKDELLRPFISPLKSLACALANIYAVIISPEGDGNEGIDLVSIVGDLLQQSAQPILGQVLMMAESSRKICEELDELSLMGLLYYPLVTDYQTIIDGGIDSMLSIVSGKITAHARETQQANT